MLDGLRKSDFDPHVGETFKVALNPSEVLELKLAETQALSGDTVESSGRRPFSLVFRGGPPDRYLPQRIYDLEHPEMGTLSLFVVPLGPDREGMRYEVIFT
jgi:hypothetical protein